MTKDQARRILQEAASNEGISTENFTARIMEAMMQARSEAGEETSSLWDALGDSPTPEDMLIFIFEALNKSPLS